MSWNQISIRKPLVEALTTRAFVKEEQGCTLPETNIAPENRSSQKETGLPTINFQVLCYF